MDPSGSPTIKCPGVNDASSSVLVEFSHSVRELTHTSTSDNTVENSSIFSAPTKFVPLSKCMISQLPRRLMNRLNAFRNAAAHKLPTTSKGITPVLIQTNEQM
ncbi:unnamed protein product [Ceratitis capitata]|uniref:(Mediterranean fruit fly) hypothetical protein n=1 Tax=Ceratitis capitata TaxID=7213 RepID=A0A811UR15_CERCA|nr:unnamed protein product [Ceratitis capitata]